MKFEQYDPMRANWEKPKNKEKEKTEAETAEVIQQIKNSVEQVYQNQREATPEEIKAIRELIAETPNIVINFDDTITQPPLRDPNIPNQKPKLNQSITLIKEMVIEAHPEKEAIFAEFGKQKEKVKYFYEQCVSGISKEELNDIYNRVIDESDEYSNVRINENFFKACKHMAESRGVKKIPLFVLSLNTPELIKKFHDDNKERFDSFKEETGVEIESMAIMGNQVQFDEDGNIIGVIEHVRNENKKDYIPEGAIMMADVRETRDLVRKGVNAVNVQGKIYDSKILEVSLRANEVANIVTEFGVENDKDVREALDLLKVYANHVKILNESASKRSERHREAVIAPEISKNVDLFNKQYQLIIKLIEERSMNHDKSTD